MGKTALGTNIAFNCAIKYQEEKDEFENKKIIDGGKVAFFSLEMSSEQLATRILAERTKISGDKMRKAELNKDDFNKIAKSSAELEFGDLLFSLVNYARFIGINPDDALSRTNQKFRSRFVEMEKKISERQINMNQLKLDDWEKLWQEVKSET